MVRVEDTISSGRGCAKSTSGVTNGVFDDPLMLDDSGGVCTFTTATEAAAELGCSGLTEEILLLILEAADL